MIPVEDIVDNLFLSFQSIKDLTPGMQRSGKGVGKGDIWDKWGLNSISNWLKKRYPSHTLLTRNQFKTY